MKLLLTTETERELAAGLPSANEPEVADYMLEEVGDWLTTQATEALAHAGIRWKHAYAQSVGAGTIIQSATIAERAAWVDAIAAVWDEAETRLQAAIAVAREEARQ